jgi:hypothetical protein
VGEVSDQGTEWHLSTEPDAWRWKLEDKGVFTVNSSYRKLAGIRFGESPWSEEEKGVFDSMWKSPAPSKVVAFAWRVILNRVPTKVNLALRNILGPEDSKFCVMCNTMDESSIHLLLHCEVASLVWLKLMWWLDNVFIIPHNLFVHWDCWSGGESSLKVKKGLWLIWHAAIWVLWKARNDLIFKEVGFEVDAIVEEIKVLSWRWTLCRLQLPPCLFFEWCWDPKWCLAKAIRRP